MVDAGDPRIDCEPIGTVGFLLDKVGDMCANNQEFEDSIFDHTKNSLNKSEEGRPDKKRLEAIKDIEEDITNSGNDIDDKRNEAVYLFKQMKMFAESTERKMKSSIRDVQKVRENTEIIDINLQEKILAFENKMADDLTKREEKELDKKKETFNEKYEHMDKLCRKMEEIAKNFMSEKEKFIKEMSKVLEELEPPIEEKESNKMLSAPNGFFMTFREKN